MKTEKAENQCLMKYKQLLVAHSGFLDPTVRDVIIDEWTAIWKILLHFKCPLDDRVPESADLSVPLLNALLVFNEMWTCHFVPHRFYIETISLLKEHTTVELFFLNAKTAVYNVRFFTSYIIFTTRTERSVLSQTSAVDQ